MATDRLSEFKVGTGDQIKAELRGVGLPQVAMHSQLPRFVVSYFLFKLMIHEVMHRHNHVLDYIVQTRYT